MTALRCRLGGGCPWVVDDEAYGADLQREDHESEHRDVMASSVTAWNLEAERYRIGRRGTRRIERIAKVAR